MGQMKWGRETSENCDQDNAINNPSSVHRLKRKLTEDKEVLKKRPKRR